MTKIRKRESAIDLYLEFQKIRLNLDRVPTVNLSKIKDVINKVHFADIANDQQALDNTGDTFYKIYENDKEGDYFRNLTLSYTIEAKKVGAVYGNFKEEIDKDGEKKIVFKNSKRDFNGYGRFLVDVTSGKVIFSKELDKFIIIECNTYTVLDEITFNLSYSVEKKQKITDFLNVIEEIYRNVINVATHDYAIYPYRFCGKDFYYCCDTLEFVKHKPIEKELYFKAFDVKQEELNIEKAKDYLTMIASDEASLNNLRLLHAYTMRRKLGLEPAEQFFIIKDRGRTGKGLFMLTFADIFKINQVSFDNLAKGGFEASNEWLNFYGADLAHANESGEIKPQDMRVLRKIATSEVVTGRGIGKDAVKFKLNAVLILDTNEDVDIGTIAANTERTVKLSFKDTPADETQAQRRARFKPYWNFIQPSGENSISISANLSFLIDSLNYLAIHRGEFVFEDVAFRNYASADELTDTQRILVLVIDENGYILANNELLSAAVQEDYGSFRFAKAKTDVAKVGVRLNSQRFIDGSNNKVHVVGDKLVFNQTVEILRAEKT